MQYFWTFSLLCIIIINHHHIYDLNFNNNKEILFLANSIISFEAIKKNHYSNAESCHIMHEQSETLIEETE